jgi:Domain of unknown function (DUF3291)
MEGWQIAQMNVGSARFDLDDPRMAGFMSRLDEINAIAEASPGFIWRLQTAAGNATDIKLTDNPRFIVNMSVWRDIEALFEFAYASAHAPAMARRRDWFQPHAGAYQVLWWVPAGHLPTPAEGLARLAALDAQGPSPEAFDFKNRFQPPAGAG